MTSPRVSIVVPTYNRAESLRRLLDALDQTVRQDEAVEVLVIDDGSTDGTRDVLEASTLNGLVFRRQSNAGAAAARNYGIRIARGEYVLFTDDDCVPSQTWIVDMVTKLDEEPVLAGVGGAIEPLHRGYLADFAQAERLADHSVDADGTVQYLATANAVFRRDALLRVGGFDEDFPHAAGEDVDLSVRIRQVAGPLAVIVAGSVMHDHRHGIRSMTRTYWQHGEARRRLARRHPQLSVSLGAQRAVSLHQLTARYDRYRSRASLPRAISYVALRAAMLAAFLGGMAFGRVWASPQ